MALDERTIGILKRLMAGSGQPGKRDFARALVTLDEAVGALTAQLNEHIAMLPRPFAFTQSETRPTPLDNHKQEKHHVFKKRR